MLEKLKGMIYDIQEMIIITDRGRRGEAKEKSKQKQRLVDNTRKSDKKKVGEPSISTLISIMPKRPHVQAEQ